MKLIDEKGKLFGLINLVDLACLLLILLVLAGVGWKLLGPKVEEAVAPTAKMTTVLRIRGAYPYTLDWLHENDLVGEKLVMGTGYVDATVTKVEFFPLSDREIESYIATGEPMDKAGAYGIQGRGALLVKRIHGDYFTVVGLPIAEVVRHLPPEVQP